MGKIILCLSVLTVLVGCATQQGLSRNYVHKIKSPFDEIEMRNLLRDGTNTIKGNAFIRKSGGAVVSCAGARVILTSKTNYSTEVLYLSFGHLLEGKTSIFNSKGGEVMLQLILNMQC